MSSRKVLGHLPSKWITPVAVLGVTVLVLLLYDRWLLFVDFLNPIFGNVYVFVGSYVLCLGLIAATFIWGNPNVLNVLARIYLLIGILAALAFPLLLPSLYGHYQPYAKPAPEYEMQWITQPSNRFSSAFKNAQRAHDKHGCTYRLYGWSADNVLYYGSDCRFGFWQYDPARDSEPRPVSRIPDVVKDRSSVDRGIHFDSGVIFYPEYPQGFDPSTRFSFIVYEKVSSPDGRWVAAAIKNFYGPRDVVILRAKG